MFCLENLRIIFFFFQENYFFLQVFVLLRESNKNSKLFSEDFFSENNFQISFFMDFCLVRRLRGTSEYVKMISFQKISFRIFVFS